LRIWDALAWILFLFPILTGGIWFRRPGLKLELTEASIPVLVLTVLGFTLHHLFQTRLEEASSVRFVLWLWNRWRKEVLDRPNTALWSMAGLVGTLESWVALRRHWAYGSGAADLGIFTNAIWNLTHGNGYISSVKDGMNLFMDHQSPIFWLFYPVFSLFPHPETLLVLQAFGMTTTGVALYYLSKQYLKAQHWGLAALPLLYWAYLPMRNANSFDFHPEVFLLPLLLWAIVGLQSQDGKSRLRGLIALLVSLGAKESAPAVVVGIGIAWILGAGPITTRSFTRKLGVLLIPLGTAVFYFDTQIVPRLFGRTYAYEANYKAFGSGLSGIFLAPILHPVVFWSRLLGPLRLKFLFWTLAPLGFLPLLNWRAALAALPGYLILFISDGDHRVGLIYHYATEASVGLFWAMPMALLHLEKIKGRKPTPTTGHTLSRARPQNGLRAGVDLTGVNWRILWLLFWAFGTMGRSEVYRLRDYQEAPHHLWLSKQLIPCLSQAPASVSGSMVPHLATRPWIHHLPRFEMKDGSPVSCVVFDPDINNWPLQSNEMARLEVELTAKGYSKEYQCGKVWVYKLNSAGSPCLECTPPCP